MRTVSAGAGAGFTVSAADRLTPPAAAVSVAAVEVVTVRVVIPNEALLAPAGTVTLAGTTAAAFPEARLTTIPPAGAAPERVTVPVAALAPVTLVGLTESPPR